ncbi:MAG: hypothetical protein GY862_27040 [Gammaproteobacteria bacterium]|nr:hypothetical protein [Gammaproteobacteria bacterium]MCP5013852.1 hypothetical protein [Ketobacter sp.]
MTPLEHIAAAALAAAWLFISYLAIDVWLHWDEAHEEINRILREEAEIERGEWFVPFWKQPLEGDL